MKITKVSSRLGDKSMNDATSRSISREDYNSISAEGRSNANDGRFFNDTKDTYRPEFRPQVIDDKYKELGLASYKKEHESGHHYLKAGLKIFFAFISAVIILVVIFGGYLLFKIEQSSSKIFKGSMTDVISKKDPLKIDQYGRSNFLVFGTSEDDPDHSGALLADSIMVVGINIKTGAANVLSIPRDFWIDYGIDCPFGDAGKINAAYVCALETNGYDQDKAGIYFAQKVSEVLGIEIHYYASVNYSAIRGVVDALDGIQVNIQSDDPRGIYDAATKLNLSNGIQILDGKTALILARARNSEGGYGLERSNFDREKNQQLIMNAIRDKALNSGTLTDINKVISLMEVLGDNVRTNLEGAEVRSVISAIQNIDADGIVPISISEGDSKLVTTGTQNSQSIVLPIAGLYEYDEISKYVNAVWSEE